MIVRLFVCFMVSMKVIFLRFKLRVSLFPCSFHFLCKRISSKKGLLPSPLLFPLFPIYLLFPCFLFFPSFLSFLFPFPFLSFENITHNTTYICWEKGGIEGKTGSGGVVVKFLCSGKWSLIISFDTNNFWEYFLHTTFLQLVSLYLSGLWSNLKPWDKKATRIPV